MTINIRQTTLLSKIDLEQFNVLLDEDTSWSSAHAAIFLANPGNILFVAEFEKKIIGFLSAYFLQRFDTKKSEVLLYELSVHKDFRKKGIGSKLVESVKKWAQTKDASEVWVLAHVHDDVAMEFYRATGGVADKDQSMMFTYKL